MLVKEIRVRRRCTPAFPIWLGSGEAIAAERDLQVVSD